MMEHEQSITLFDKVWDRHVVHRRADGYQLLYIDRHLLHDGSSEGFARLQRRGLTIRRPDLSLATPDHFNSTATASLIAIQDPHKRSLVERLRDNAKREGIVHFALGEIQQGIAHVVGPEQGFTLPGITLVCGDSHTATHGALGALAFGIGSSEVTHVMATQTLWQRKPKALRVLVEGAMPSGVYAKDIVLRIIAELGAGGGVGHVIEYAGSTIRSLSIEARLTICNMSIEAGARAGMIAPDDVTFEYLADRPKVPQGQSWDKALLYWRTLKSDEDALFSKELHLDASSIQPMITWGTSPEDCIGINEKIPVPESFSSTDKRQACERALAYMDLRAGDPINTVAVDRVFIGSCTNSRIEDLRVAASVAKGRKVTVPAWVVPGSGLVKREAEAEGLDQIFRDAGFEWRQPGCSMCVGMNGDVGYRGERIVSTSNRNFMGRQGPGVRTHLASPATAVACAVLGRIASVEHLQGN